MRGKTFLMLAVLFLWAGIATAQTVRVTGVVTSAEDGEPVTGASVIVKGTTQGTITNINGEFVIPNVSADAREVVVTYVGYKPAEGKISPGGKGRVIVVLQPDNELLEEVVVTAQGLTRKEKSVGYAMQKITGEDLTVARQTDLGNSLAGKIAGARFYGASGATFDSGSIVLRGTTTYSDMAGDEPIYVVDGTITNKNSINMDDVDQISVLKGAAATALYGSQGGNGAIIITTKSGAKARGKGEIEFSQTFQWETYYNHYKMQKLYGGGSYGIYGEYYGASTQTYDYASAYGDLMSPEFLYGTFGGMQNSDGSYYYDYYSDESWGARFDKDVQVASALYWDETSSKYQQAEPWQYNLKLKDLFRTGTTTTTNVAFSKAGEDYHTRVSFTNVRRDGIQPNSSAVRQYLGVKTSYKPTNWLNVSLDYKFTYHKNHNAAAEGYASTGNVLYSYIQWGQTNVNLKDYKDYERPDGSWRAWNIIDPTDLTANYHDNPYATFDKRNNYTTQRWNVFTGDVEVLLPYNIKAGVRVMGNLKSYNYESEYAEGSINWTSRYYEAQYHTSDIFVQGRLTWSDRFLNDKLSVDAAAFIEEERYDYGQLYAYTADGLTIDGYYNLAASTGYVNAYNSETHYKTRSLYGTVTLGYDDTYFLDGSLRNDWDSKLPTSGNSFLYGGLSASVMLNKFIEDKAPWVNYWKLRASFAQVGSTLSAYSTTPTYTVSKYNSVTGLYGSTTQLNQSIKPTISTTYEVGTEFRLLNNRIWGDVNWYRRDSKNQILSVNVAPQSGYAYRQLNAGLVRNEGWEIQLGGTPVKTKDFQWNLNFNAATNNNKLVRLNEDIDEYTLGGNSFYYYWYIKAMVGKPVGVMTTMARWARDDDGTLHLTPTTSHYWGGGYRPTYETSVEKEVGNYQPDWTGGFSTDLHYKNFSLSASFDFMIGGKLVSWSNMWGRGSGTAKESAVKNANGVNEREPITQGGGVMVHGIDDTTGEEVDCYMNAYYYYHYQAYYDLDEWVYDRTYVKMRELALSYTFSPSLLAKANIGLTHASISFVATNPWLIYSACPNIDPSESSSNYIEGGQAASTRSFGVTIKLGF